MMTTRKNKLLIAAAVAALMTGSGFALAQGAPDAGTKANPAAKSAPAEKMAPSTATQKAPSAAEQKAPGAAEQKAPGAANKGAQKSEDKSLPSKRTSQTAPANKSKSETTGQAPTSQGGERSKSESTKSDSTRSESTKSGTTESQPSSKSTQDKANSDTSRPNQSSQSNQPGANQNRGAAGTTTTNTNVSANLSAEQRTKIHQVIVSDRSAPRVSRVDFQLNVGAAVPRSVKLATVPSTIVEIQPAWRGFEYFLVGEEIVIVNPRTMEIVAVIPA
jgi:hypothetical protein